jgi:hypothetical protein
MMPCIAIAIYPCFGGIYCFQFQGNFLKMAAVCSLKKVKVKFSLEQAMKAQRGSRGIALLFL